MKVSGHAVNPCVFGYLVIFAGDSDVVNTAAGDVKDYTGRAL